LSGNWLAKLKGQRKREDEVAVCDLLLRLPKVLPTTGNREEGTGKRDR
jgi:hypothetical protein